MAELAPEIFVQAPKVLLHDHLDGGMRPETVVELAAETGYAGLPTTDVDELAAWVRRGADRNKLELYLETFAHTVGVTQTPDAIERAAHEAAEDLAKDGVVYAELRFAPEQHMQQGLSLDEVVEASLRGIRSGSAGTDLTIGIICSAMRQEARSYEIAELAIRHRDEGVIGFDIADITVDEDGRAELGRLASFVRDTRVPLEMCPTSNVNTGAAASIAEHPIGLLRRLRFRVTVNTDNRLMSNVELSDEFAKLHEAFGYSLSDMEWLTLNAMKSAFWPFEQRLKIINEIIKPRYATLRDANL